MTPDLTSSLAWNVAVHGPLLSFVCLGGKGLKITKYGITCIRVNDQQKIRNDSITFTDFKASPKRVFVTRIAL